jgi:enoyl-CoA hydratase/carnithine racemase
MTIRIERNAETGTATIHVDRPEKRNALSREMLTDLKTAFKNLPTEDGVRVLILRGADDVFSAGADIEEFAARVDDPRAEAAFVDVIHEVYEAVEHCPVPVIAALEGPAVGAGTEIALAADLRVATPSASIALTEINIAMIPPFERLTQYMSRGTVRELCLTGRPLDAQAAADAGVFNRLVDPADLDRTILDLAETIAEKSPHAIRRTKEALRYGETATKAATIEYRKRLEYECYDHPDFAKSVRAFSDGNRPDFSP